MTWKITYTYNTPAGFSTLSSPRTSLRDAERSFNFIKLDKNIVAVQLNSPRGTLLRSFTR